MANFKTHFSIAAYISGFLAGLLLVSGKGAPQQVVLFFIMGIIGGFLPDIDSDDSKSFRLSFSMTGITISFLTVFYFGLKYSLIEIIIIWVAVYLIIKFIFYQILSKFTVHRGIIHSIPAGVCISLIFTNVSYYILKLGNTVSWCAGVFLLIGFIIHLSLDELYSFNIFSIPIKKSFGSALKLFSKKNLIGSILIYIMIVIFIYISPPFDEFRKKYISADAVKTIFRNFLPSDGWFRNKNN